MSYIIYIFSSVMLLILIASALSPKKEIESFDNLNPPPTVKKTIVVTSTPVREDGKWYIDDKGRVLYHYDKGASVDPTPNASIIPAQDLKNDITVGYDVNGSELFRLRIHEAIEKLSKHDASFELIRMAGFFTVTESETPCDPPIVAGCSIINLSQIEIQHHEDQKFMRIVMIHEIAHLAKGLSECMAIKAEIDYMRGTPEYNSYHLRPRIEERQHLAC